MTYEPATLPPQKKTIKMDTIIYLILYSARMNNIKKFATETAWLPTTAATCSTTHNCTFICELLFTDIIECLLNLKARLYLFLFGAAIL